jgi:hypothetical protein
MATSEAFMVVMRDGKLEILVMKVDKSKPTLCFG